MTYKKYNEEKYINKKRQNENLVQSIDTKKKKIETNTKKKKKDKKSSLLKLKIYI